MQALGSLIKPIEEKKDNRVTNEFQVYALHLAEKLNDKKHIGIYMRLAKTQPRGRLESALSYVIDARVDNKGRLFLWKVKQLRLKK